MKYKIVRFFRDLGSPIHQEVIKNRVTLKEAQAHCSDPETSSSTCKKRENVERTESLGAWFDGYTSIQ